MINNQPRVTLSADALAELRRELSAAVLVLDRLEGRARLGRHLDAGEIETLQDRLADIGTQCATAGISLGFAVAAS